MLTIYHAHCQCGEARRHGEWMLSRTTSWPYLLGLRCVAVCCSVLQCVAVCCSVLQCVVVCCSVLQCVAVLSGAEYCHDYLLIHTRVAVCRVVLQYVAVCCNMLQCVAVCCNAVGGGVLSRLSAYTQAWRSV